MRQTRRELGGHGRCGRLKVNREGESRDGNVKRSGIGSICGLEDTALCECTGLLDSGLMRSCSDWGSCGLIGLILTGHCQQSQPKFGDVHRLHLTTDWGVVETRANCVCSIPPLTTNQTIHSAELHAYKSHLITVS